MNRTLTSITLSALCLCFTAQHANAQNRSVDTSKLPKADQIYKAPYKIQIVDTTPKITSTPAAPDPNQIFVIPMSKLQAPATEIIYVNPPGGGGISGLPPGMAAVNVTQPPASRFGSNIPAAGTFAPGNLKPGYSSNGLQNQKFVSGQMKGPTAKAVNTPVSTRPEERSVGGLKPLVYDSPSYGQGVGGSGSTSVMTTRDVKAVRLPRRTLLDHAKAPSK